MKIALALACALALATPAAHAETQLKMDIGGRIEKTAEGYAYQWPAVYFEARFKGSSVRLAFDDPSNNFNVVVDGRDAMILRKPGRTSLTLSQLGAGPHVIRLEKRSETQYATGAFDGFFVPRAADALAPQHRTRQIEFIGDSLTVGYGNTSAFTQCTPDEIFETTDSQEGFGPLVAKHFDADYQVNAFSGLGIVRNYDGHEHPKYHMPMLYPRAIFDDPKPAAEPDWHPQVIVIGIGGNDFSTPLHDDEPWKTADDLKADYIRTYTAFVQNIRATNPGAFIILATPPGREDGYEQGTDAVFANMTAAGETRIDRVTLPELQSTGCNGHPNIHSDADVANMYIGYIEAHPALWQGK